MIYYHEDKVLLRNLQKHHKYNMIDVKTTPYFKEISERATYLNMDIYKYLYELGFHCDFSNENITESNLKLYLRRAYPLHTIPSITNIKKLYPNMFAVIHKIVSTLNNNVKKYRQYNIYLENLGYTFGEPKITEDVDSLISYLHPTYTFNCELINHLVDNFRITKKTVISILQLTRSQLADRTNLVIGTNPFIEPTDNNITDREVLDAISYMTQNKIYEYKDEERNMHIRIAWDVNNAPNYRVVVIYRHNSTVKACIDPVGEVRIILTENDYYKYNDLDLDLINYIDTNLGEYRHITWDNQVKYAYDHRLAYIGYFGTKLRKAKNICKIGHSHYYDFLGRGRFTVRDKCLKEAYDILSKYLTEGDVEYPYLLLEDDDYDRLAELKKVSSVSAFEMFTVFNIKCEKILRKSSSEPRINYIKKGLKEACIRENLAYVSSSTILYKHLHTLANKYRISIDEIMERFGYVRVKKGDLPFLQPEE